MTLERRGAFWFQCAVCSNGISWTENKRKGKRKIFGGERSLDRQKRHKGIL